ncbi:MAG: hypothetical protein N3E36_06095 [Sulfolobales archaeon]|nr:hypothetical protein [Sulfolobales archaeon]MCX8199576.1 hypothetical protein [Sulfolobales archaeon]MDW8170529.1 hypothetical protein [Desulfurococcaceae archaeon]
MLSELRVGFSEFSPYYVVAKYPTGLERPWENIDKTLAENVVKYVGRAAGFR